MMKHARSTQPPAHEVADVAVLIATVRSSSILVPASGTTARDEASPRVAGALPYGDKVDIQILEWIASHGRGKRRSGWLM
jgi:hypothetical protein